MVYQKIEILFSNTNSQSCKFRKNNWVNVNDDEHGICNKNSQINVKTTMLKSILSGCSETYILVKRTLTIIGVEVDADARNAAERNMQITFKNCAPFTDCVKQINNIQVDNARELDVVVLM